MIVGGRLHWGIIWDREKYDQPVDLGRHGESLRISRSDTWRLHVMLGLIKDRDQANMYNMWI
jgi:hypothetical protein